MMSRHPISMSIRSGDCKTATDKESCLNGRSKPPFSANCSLIFAVPVRNREGSHSSSNAIYSVLNTHKARCTAVRSVAPSAVQRSRGSLHCVGRAFKSRIATYRCALPQYVGRPYFTGKERKPRVVHSPGSESPKRALSLPPIPRFA